MTLGTQSRRFCAIEWSPDGRRLAAASEDKIAEIWDAQTGQELRVLTGHQDDVGNVAWSRDGRLATVSRDKTAEIWDADTGKELHKLRGHQGEVWGLSWSPDGRRIVTSSRDGTARIWDAESGRELLTLHGQDHVWSVAWSPDGKRLASSSEDGIVQIYALDDFDLLRLVRSRITRSLSEDECRRYLNTQTCPPLPAVP